MVLSELLESVPAGGSEAFVQFWPESPAVRGDLSRSLHVGQLLVLRPVCGWPMQYATNVRELIGQLDSFYIVRQQGDAVCLQLFAFSQGHVGELFRICQAFDQQSGILAEQLPDLLHAYVGVFDDVMEPCGRDHFPASALHDTAESVAQPDG